MRRQILLPAVAFTGLLLSGCSAASPVPAVTVTVTAPVPRPTPQAGDAARWDLSAVCAVQSEIATLAQWRQQQVQADRLTAAQSAAVLQAVAVQNLRLTTSGVPDSVATDAATLARASGTLEHPGIDLEDPAVQRAQQRITDACQAAGLTIGVLAQGG